MILGATVRGVDGCVVRVSRRPADGLPRFKIVGVSAASEREARVRVQAALAAAGVELDSCTDTEVVCDAGAAMSLDGLGLDLAIALTIAADPDRPLAVGALAELSLAGEVRPVRGVLSAVEALRKVVGVVIVAPENAAEAALVAGVDVYAVRTLADALSVVNGMQKGAGRLDLAVGRSLARPTDSPQDPDMRDVRGQQAGRRALEIAAAGTHHLLLVGSPGAGKTMLARRLPGLLPKMTADEALEVTRVHSAAGLNVGGGLATTRPFRAPHHSTTPPGLVGGGALATRPGEVSLAHGGVLFLDDLNEFSRASLEVLREPLAAGDVVLSRASGPIRFPASTVLVASVLPCPCGYRGGLRCHCTAADVERYFGRIPKALLDLFDVRVKLPSTDVSALADESPGESSASICARIIAAREHRAARGATVPPQRVNRVARTIADLALSADILPEHLAEASTFVELAMT